MRHHYIEHGGDEVRVVLERFVSLAAVTGAHDCKAFLLEHCTHQTQYGWIVVGDQNASLCVVAAAAQLFFCQAASTALPASPALMESSAASLIAAIILECSAIPLPAMSNAVP